MALETFRRILKTRKLFMPWATTILTVVFAAPMFWVLGGSIGPFLFLFIALVSWGLGWLTAFYVWHFVDAVQYESGPLRPAKREKHDGKVGDV
jgi:hypothetical protein